MHHYTQYIDPTKQRRELEQNKGKHLPLACARSLVPIL